MRRTVILILVLLMDFICYANFLSLNDVNVGQKGIGITRWSQNKIKKFEVEVLGVLKNNPKSGVVIAKINDDEIKESGVVAGMSGSPVYIDGKLVGAVAFTWSFLKEPIVGITPIQDMISLEEYSHRYVSLPSDVKYITPILMSGVSSVTRKLLEEEFKSDNIVFLNSFSSFGVSKETLISNNFIPGDAIGINLVSGDMELTAIGTVTYVDNDKIFALGHPAFLRGKTSIPISEVDVVAIIPRQSLSFKIGVPKRIVGSLEFDGSSGIFGIIGKTAPTVKVSVNVDRKELYRYEIAKDNTLLSSLISTVLTESILRTKGLGGEGNVVLDCGVSFRFKGFNSNFVINFKDIVPTYRLEDGYYLSLSSVNSILDFLIYNPIFEVDISEIHIEVRTQPLDVGFIAFVIPSKVMVSPGEEIKLTVGIKKIRDEIVVREFNIKIPTWVQSGTRINIGAMNKGIRSIQKISSYPESFSFDTYERLYNFIYNDLRVDKLVVFMEIPSGGVASGGYIYNLLPNHLSTIFSLAPRSKNILPFSIEYENYEEFPIAGVGLASVFVR